MGFPTTLAGVLEGNESHAALYIAGEQQEISRGELGQAIRGFALSLRASGIRPGDVVSIAEANTVSFPSCKCPLSSAASRELGDVPLGSTSPVSEWPSLPHTSGHVHTTSLY